jgi:benzoyl-CoA reductase/2-hydroxyglutaryl-CoA dehydratase subunit BcrC/BadD/HgdB
MLTFERTFEQCQELIADLSFERFHRWKDQHPGSRVIGYFPVYAPVEIIHAAGMLPVGLNGGGDRLDIQYADARFGSFICSIIKTTLEMGLTDHLNLRTLARTQPLTLHRLRPLARRPALPGCAAENEPSAERSAR